MTPPYPAGHMNRKQPLPDKARPAEGTVSSHGYNGVPFKLLGNVEVETSDENYKLFLSQDEHSSLNSTHAASPDMAATNNRSLLSMQDCSLSHT